MCSGHDNLRSLGRASDLKYVDLDAVVKPIGLGGHLLRRRQQRLDLAEVHEYITLFPALDGAGTHFADPISELLVDPLSFRFADPLHNNLLGRLSGYSSEVSYS